MTVFEIESCYRCNRKFDMEEEVEVIRLAVMHSGRGGKFFHERSVPVCASKRICRQDKTKLGITTIEQNKVADA